MKKFNKNFIFSASTNSFQIEGGRSSLGRTASIWDKFTKDNYFIPKENSSEREINSIEVAADFFNRFKQDVKIMKSMGLSAFIYNLDWSRVISKEGVVNKEGLKWIANVFEELNINGIKPIPIIFHWDTPIWLEKKGGVSGEHFLSNFKHFCEILFKHLGKFTDIWFVNDENSSFTISGYKDDYFPPGKNSKKEMLRALHNLNLSAAIAKIEFEKAKKKGYVDKKSLLGIDHDWSPGIPYDLNDVDDKRAVESFNKYFLNVYLDPNILGEYPKEFYDFLSKEKMSDLVSMDDKKLLKNNTLDLIGWNYYRPTFVADMKREKEDIDWFLPGGKSLWGDFYLCNPKGYNYTEWNWLINSSMLLKGAEILEKRYKKPIMIVENGIGYLNKSEGNNMPIDDRMRIDYLNEHLREVQRVVEKGINLIGYSLWTYCDIFSPSAGYRKKYGLVEVDFYNNTLNRYPKSSYFWYRDVIERKSTYNMDKIPYEDYYLQAKDSTNHKDFGFDIRRNK